MSLRSLGTRVLATALAVCLIAPSSTALAAPSAAQTASDQAQLAAAVGRYERASSKSAQLESKARASSARLDRIMAEQQATQARLNSRASTMYRSGRTEFISLLLKAATFQQFAANWDMLVRMSREDAKALMRLRRLQSDAKRSVTELLALQEQQAKAQAALAREVTAAERELKSSQAALDAYRQQMAKAAAADTPKAAPAARKKAPRKDPTQQRTGSGAWKTAVASHYGRNFSGRAANGERIGPYSMIVAHKTLPFGTLVEFEYKGKRAVARVVDRGPHVAGRTFDLGPGVVRVLDFEGVNTVRYRVIGG